MNHDPTHTDLVVIYSTRLICSFFNKTDMYSHIVSKASGRFMTYAFTEKAEVFKSPCCESDFASITSAAGSIGRAQLYMTDRNPELSEVPTKVSWPFK
jgi:hypothetical protein